MSLHVCMSCGTVYLPAELCPHCGYDSFRYDWEEPDVDIVDLKGDARETIRKAMAEPKSAADK